MARPLALLTREMIAARIASLRDALDTLADQSDRDGAGAYHCLGAMKVELFRLESDIRKMDRAVNFFSHAEVPV